MSDLLVRYAVDGPVATLCLNRPDKLNAINPVMIEQLHAALDRAEADASVRVILLRGEGRAFSAGFDMDVDAPAEIGDQIFGKLRGAEYRHAFAANLLHRQDCFGLNIVVIWQNRRDHRRAHHRNYSNFLPELVGGSALLGIFSMNPLKNDHPVVNQGVVKGVADQSSEHN